MKRIFSLIVFFIIFTCVFTAHAGNGKVITASWTYPEDIEIAGFRLYANHKLVQTFEDPALREWTGRIWVKDGDNIFGITAYTADGLESAFSNEVIVNYDFTPPAAPILTEIE
ncbi:MAG TPA: hypothetical protein ENG35_07670 [Desulfobacteraceae bacterium]|nr:hypothetical protein [Desulfobacteraceae bacterium]